MIQLSPFTNERKGIEKLAELPEATSVTIKTRIWTQVCQLEAQEHDFHCTNSSGVWCRLSHVAWVNQTRIIRKKCLSPTQLTTVGLWHLNEL